VGDESTVRLVARFYAGLAQGLPVADALRAAKLEMLRRGAAPAGWAAFTVVGDPLVQVPLRRFARSSAAP
jgi:CHAT domain-containing protein